ncbi:hypothetical protein [Streptomyces violarus]|uniref:hypothetical protein n=1 Tax=Streptomyces violarus TaxID=67380 RepID=UPI0021C054A6|nr:hypothetical protein [Streptomyces violarus]MCT9144674.1 hypothetical protein [Streptomyces violarus]
MRKAVAAFATLGLAVLGLTATATSAHADAVCDSKFPSDRDGMVRAWQLADCSGTYLGGTESYDSDWGNSSGPFQGTDENRATSVMNSGKYGGEDVVAFYRLTGFQHKEGYGCLKPGELYVDNLSRNKFTTATDGTRYNMDNRISSHQWVKASDCRSGSFIS